MRSNISYGCLKVEKPFPVYAQAQWKNSGYDQTKLYSAAFCMMNVLVHTGLSC